MRGWHAWSLALALGIAGCGSGAGGEETRAESAGGAPAQGEVVTPPFAVDGDAEGLLLTWFDEQGTHTAGARHEIPEERRGEVRVDSLELAPDARDPEHVFVADLREPAADSRYVVRRVPRAAFDRRVETFGDVLEGGGPATTGEVASSDVVIFGASWCGACRETEAYLRGRGVPFVERDIERDPGAREDMQRRAARAGISPRGIPVTDFRGRIIQGFDRPALDRAIRETSSAPGAGGGISI
ncbi:MAG: glutaredoxin family protein [Myxococcota bacterium]|nr:glutaredoxin family protein [Myxococcota bacterium]